MAGAKLDLNLKVSEQDFLNRINVIEQKMSDLWNVIEKYGRAKLNIGLFMGSTDTHLEDMIERINVNVEAARAEYQNLQEIKVTMQETVNQMNSMSAKIGKTIESATENAKEAIKSVINIL